MPEPVGQFKEPDTVVGRDDVAVLVEVRKIGHARAKPLRLAAADVARRAVGLELAEMTREDELLVDGDVLVAKHEHGVAVHARFDRGDLVRAERMAAIDAGDLADKDRVQRADRDRHLRRFRDGRSSEYFPNIGQVLAAPENFAVDDEARHAEDALLLGFAANAVELGMACTGEIGGETRHVGTGFGEHGGYDRRVLDVELAFPETLEGHVVIAPEHSVVLLLRVEHADQRERGIPDLLRAADHEATFARLPPAIHVAVFDAAPLMRVPAFLDDPAPLVEARRAEEARDIEPIGEPIEADGEVAGELVGGILGEIGVRALVIDIDHDGARLEHLASSWPQDIATETGRQ